MPEARGPNPPEDPDPDPWRQTLRDVAGSVASVLLVGGFLFAVSGVWPPLVAIESQSMTPNVEVGDLVVVMEADRFPGAGAHDDSGVVTHRTGDETGYAQFGRPGDVIVYTPGGDDSTTPIIHRAMFWVDAGENWFARSDGDARGPAENCAAMANCPAPHGGFITKGDFNANYDQVTGLSGPVRPEWVVGTAEHRIPWLGCVRLVTSAPDHRPAACTLGLF